MDYSATVFPWQEGSRFLILKEFGSDLKLKIFGYPSTLRL